MRIVVAVQLAISIVLSFPLFSMDIFNVNKDISTIDITKQDECVTSLNNILEILSQNKFEELRANRFSRQYSQEKNRRLQKANDCLQGALHLFNTDFLYEQSLLDNFLLLACYYNDLIFIRKLIEKGANVNVCKQEHTNYITPISLAYRNNNLDVIKILLHTEKINLSLLTEPNSYPLLWQIIISGINDPQKNNLLSLLLSYDAKYNGKTINTTLANGDTFFHIICKKYANNPYIIQCLLENGLNPNIANNKGKSPLHLLLKHSSNPAVLYAHLQCFSKYKTNMKAIDKNGNNFLHTIIYNDNSNSFPDLFENIQFLITQGVSAHHVNLNKENALHIFIAKAELCFNESYKDASLYYEKIIEKLIIEGGADVNAKNIYGFTPLHYAANETHFECVPMLLAHGANLNIKNNDEFTPKQYLKNPTMEIDLFLNYTPENLSLKKIFSPKFADSSFMTQWKNDTYFKNRSFADRRYKSIGYNPIK